ncbi:MULTISPECIES: hypothetical protein [Nocardia]|nr:MULTISPECIES: hypothetical protein [unclassified Nocardia]MBF6189828.1 hypothetical protein [Nocardia beijingensis]MEA3526939.1 hypothetical protein [Nocardia sp. CDC192]
MTAGGRAPAGNAFVLGAARARQASHRTVASPKAHPTAAALSVGVDVPFVLATVDVAYRAQRLDPAVAGAPRRRERRPDDVLSSESGFTPHSGPHDAH